MKMNKDYNKYRYFGKCSHNVEFEDCLSGCNIDCIDCNNKGKIEGYDEEKLRSVEK